MEDQVTEIKHALAVIKKYEKSKGFIRFLLAVVGVIPWVGSTIAATAAYSAEKDQGEMNELYRLWMEENHRKLGELGATLDDVFHRFNGLTEDVQKRIESDEYLQIVRRAFRSWDQAETQEKRTLVRKLITRAGATQVCPDDLVRLFIDWIDRYHEAHFAVIKMIYKKPGITRGQIWDQGHASRPTESSSEADLFKRLIRDLSTDGVIRQHRPIDGRGNFIKPRPEPKGTASNGYTSAFDNKDPYELTELGKQFVHYVMEEVVTMID